MARISDGSPSRTNPTSSVPQRKGRSGIDWSGGNWALAKAYLRDFIAAHPDVCGVVGDSDNPARLPRGVDLQNLGGVEGRSLYTAIRNKMTGYPGGHIEFGKNFAAELGITPPKKRWDDNNWEPTKEYFRDFFVRKGDEPCCRTEDGQRCLPPHSQIEKDGNNALLLTIRRAKSSFPKGFSDFAIWMAAELGVEPPVSLKVRWDENDWDPAENFLINFVSKESNVDICRTKDGKPCLPAAGEFQKRGGSAVYNKIQQDFSGGYVGFLERVAKKTGLQLPPVRNNWQRDGDWKTAKSAVADCAEQHDLRASNGQRRLPTHTELTKFGLGGLYLTISRNFPGKYPGFVDDLAAELGVLARDNSSEIRAKNLEEVFDLAAELSPLVEAGLISRPLRMLTLLRAGQLRGLEEAQLRMALSYSGKSKSSSEDKNALDEALEETLDTDVLPAPRTGSDDVSWDELNKDKSQTSREKEFLSALQRVEDAGLVPDDTLLLQLRQDFGNLFLPRLAGLDVGGGLLSSNSQQVLQALEELHPELLATVSESPNGLVAQGLSTFAAFISDAVALKETLDGSSRWTTRSERSPRIHQFIAASLMANAIAEDGFILNAQDPGVGKTVSVLMAIAASPKVKRVFVVAPKSVADETWASSSEKLGEIEKWLPGISTVYRGVDASLQALQSPAPEDGIQFFVLHYEELRKPESVAALAAVPGGFDVAVLDEIQLVKQRQGLAPNQARVALESLRSIFKSRIGVTGTALTNELKEPLSKLELLSGDPDTFSVAALRTSSVEHRAQVYALLLPHLVRHRFEDVMGHVPAAQVQTVPIEIPAKWEDELARLYSLPAAENSAKVVEMAKLLAQVKLPYFRSQIDEIPGKVLVLSSLVEGVSRLVAEDLQGHLGKPGAVVSIDGGTSDSDRQKALAAFRAPISEGGAKVLVTTYGTGGVGVTPFNPSAAPEDIGHHILVANLPPTYTELRQGFGRFSREGQPNSVVVRIPIATTSLRLPEQEESVPTLDEVVWELVTGKRQLSDASVDGSLDEDEVKIRNAMGRWLSSAIPKNRTPDT